MITRIRLFVLFSRPPVLILLALFAAAGMAQAGAGSDPVRLLRALVVVAGFLVSSVIVNDLADEAIDRVNLAGVAARPLVTGAGTRSELPAMAVVAAAVSIIASATIGTAAVGVVVAGLALSLSYSLRPIRIADRGAVASLLLPAGYVAVPFLVGMLTVDDRVGSGDLVLLGGLYLGFIGRIVLKDFRDVRGDAVFGKRTFLVRHGRRRTCAMSALGWVAGSIALLGVREVSPALAASQAVWVAAALVLLRRLAMTEGDTRRDEATISAIAIVGRAMIVTLIAHLGAVDAALPPMARSSIVAGIVVVMLGQAIAMSRYGPVSRGRVPASWASAAQEQEATDGDSHHDEEQEAGHPHAGPAQRGVVVAHAGIMAPR